VGSGPCVQFWGRKNSFILVKVKVGNMDLTST